jgi:hypothetical protein
MDILAETREFLRSPSHIERGEYNNTSIAYPVYKCDERDRQKAVDVLRSQVCQAFSPCERRRGGRYGGASSNTRFS